MAKGIFIKHFAALRADDDEARAILSTIKMGEAVTVEVKKARNIKHHRLYWKLMEVVFHNQEYYRSKEELSDAFKLAVGHSETMRGPKGSLYQKPKSISFAKMDQAQFNEFFNKAVNFMCSDVIPGLNSSDLINEVHEILGE